MGFEPIKRVSVSEQIFEQLKQKIIEGEWKQGEKLPSENELAETLQVSRVSIRQALHKLVALGLTETRTGEGSFVRELEPGVYMQRMIPMAYLNPRDTMEILDFRYVIEVETAALAARHCTPEDIRDLKDQLQVMLDNRGSYWEFSKADLEFHMLIARITRNSLIIGTYTILRDILEVCMKETVENLGVEVGIPYHRQLIEAFEKRDANTAKEVMRAHMMSTKKEFSQALDQISAAEA